MGADKYINPPMTLRQKVAGAVANCGVDIPMDKIGTVIDAVVTALEPPVVVPAVDQKQEGAE